MKLYMQELMAITKCIGIAPCSHIQQDIAISLNTRPSCNDNVFFLCLNVLTYSLFGRNPRRWPENLKSVCVSNSK